MKLVLHSLMGSIIIHIVYLAGTLFIGYIKTRSYKPDIAGAWETVDTLQQKTAFGVAVSPLFFLFTFAGAAFICGMLIYSFNKKF